VPSGIPAAPPLTQNPQAAQEEVVSALGIEKEKVVINVTLLGGGFSRKSKPDFIAEVALLSRETQAPVKVVWSREDDIRHDYYHSVAACRYHAFAVSSFTDELAVLAGADPVEYLLDLIGPSRTIDPGVEGAQYSNYGAGLDQYPIDTGRLRRVVEQAATIAGWGRDLPRGRGRRTGGAASGSGTDQCPVRGHGKADPQPAVIRTRPVLELTQVTSSSGRLDRHGLPVNDAQEGE
jgi:CO/xanthine dehydrogenase Mo-binding subunit